MNSWKEECVHLLNILGGEATLDEIYRAFLNHRTRPYNDSYQSCIRAALQSGTKACKHFDHKKELFVMVGGKYSGRWALIEKYPRAVKQIPIKTEQKYISYEYFKSLTKIIIENFKENYNSLSDKDRKKVDEKIITAFLYGLIDFVDSLYDE